jgi:hypothetical protein
MYLFDENEFQNTLILSQTFSPEQSSLDETCFKKSIGGSCQRVASDGVKPGSARLRLEPKNRLSLIGSTEKNSGLKSLLFLDLQSAF